MNDSPSIPTLNDPSACFDWLASHGIRELERGYANLVSIAQSISESELESQWRLLATRLSNLSDPDRALNNLERFASAHQTGGHEHLLVLFSDSQYLSDLLIRDHGYVETIFAKRGRRLSRELLVADLKHALTGVVDRQQATAVVRRFKHLHTARIAWADLVYGDRLEQITEQISWLAEAVCEGAFDWSFRRLVGRYGRPRSAVGRPARYVILALGKLGGTELNYSSDIDLVMLYDDDGQTDGVKTKANREFFDQLTRDIVWMLSEPMLERPAYRVDLRLRPEGSRGRICSSYRAITNYYDFQGRTWERQALIKAKPIAGELALGQRLLDELRPWVYRRNLNRVDIAGIKALKRRIERKAIEKGESTTNVKTGHGGIRDIEFVIQFLQLLNGGVIPEVQTPNTLAAIRRLETAGCLSSAESTLLTENYRWLRKLEHRLQLMFDLQTHKLPADDIGLRQMAHRMGFDGALALKEFKVALLEITSSNRTILNHLLHGAFGNTFADLRDSGGHLAFWAEEQVPAEVDLILEPMPNHEMIQQTLAPYGFTNIDQAFTNLMELAYENTFFLSTRRCHHFLAAIAPALLKQISLTPDPEATLMTLSTVSRSLGAKGVLWELFSFNHPTMDLYVRLCAASDYLVRILKTYPGMIDELLDALQIDRLPRFDFLSESLSGLVTGAQDIEPIVHSFKNAQHLRIGIRDILGRDEIQSTHRALADVAEVCLQTVVQHEYEKYLAELRVGDHEGGPTIDCPLVLLALGKLGGREPNYHSDLDVIFLYHHDQAFESRLPVGITGQFFFSQLAANITRFVTHSVRFGSLYELDCRLRPTGKSGPLAVSLNEFSRYFQSGQGKLWERQALCKARPVFGSPALRERAMQLVRHAIVDKPWQPAMATEISEMRLAIQQDCGEHNLKRGVGGTVDVEFAVQALQLKNAVQNDSVIVSGTLEAIRVLVERGFLSSETGLEFSKNYQCLRNIESHLRLINTTARHDLPEDEMSLKKLAFLLDADSPEAVRSLVADARRTIRQRYLEVFAAM